MRLNLVREEFHKDFAEVFEGRALFNASASNFTTFRTGGPISVVLFPSNEDEIKKALELCDKWRLEFIALGSGSNVLFSDKGFGGVVIVLSECFNRFSYESEIGNDVYVSAQAGAFLPKMVSEFAKKNIGGIEWACGIPGTVGGAVVGNAGSFGYSIMTNVENAKVIKKSGKIHLIEASEIESGYRFSSIGQDEIITNITLKLTRIGEGEGEKKIEEYRERRKRTQPYLAQSAGCIFKNTEKISAGRLIDECGLKGKRVGDAEVSSKHANFIINKGNATSTNILDLMKEIREEVYRKKGIMLEPEIKVIGEEIEWKN
ncbi:MAG: UDP-N-acetylmuramate dehydrogenase [Candidatus Schekmanbacteria bacterium]|nr:MAG: UDP-N-acetylmuramate dehydrogenase [Candidatus Schekmanbacteria bacterium]